MISSSYKIKFTILGALIVPCFGLIALHGTNFQYDLYRYFVPLLVGGLSGYFIGMMKDKWFATNKNLNKANKSMKQEIKDHKLSRQALQDSEDKFRSLVEMTSDWIWEVNTKGIYTYVSPIVEKILGYTPEEIVGKSSFSLMPPNESERNKEIFNYLFEKGEPIITLENVYQHKDGRLVIVETSGFPILDAARKITGYRGMDRDITERKRAKKALLASETRFRNLVESIKEVIYEIDMRGQITYISPAIESIVGYKPQELIGRPFRRLLHQEDLSRLIERFQKILSGHLKSNEYRFVAKSDEIYWIRASSRPIYEENNVIGIRGVLVDITESKQLQMQLQQLQKMESIGTMAGGIAHDFNNLLLIIMGNISLSEDNLLQSDNKAIKNLKQAEKACLRANELTKKLFTFSKGGAPFKKTASIDKLIKNTVLFAFSQSLVKPEFSIPNDLMQVEIDINQIKQVIDNIAVNAREAMHNKGLFKVCCENIDIPEDSNLTLTQGEYIKISFKDQGCGITKQNLNKIFEPYFSTKDMGVIKGQGLGLAICYSIITRHNGLISVKSELGTGSTFSIYLPSSESIKKPGFQKIEKSPEVVALEKQSASSKNKLLLMDDEEMIRSFMSEMLNLLGYDIITCIEGKEAIEIYKKAMESKEPFDAVILDLTNEFGMGGQQAMEKLLEIDHNAKGIVFTGYSDDPIVTDFKAYGFSGYLAKPATRNKVSWVISEVISKGN